MTARTPDDFWAAFFGVSVERMRSAGVTVVPHAALRGYRGVWFFAHADARIVSAPPDWVERIERFAERLQRGPLPDPELRQTIFGAEATRAIGPSYLAWLPAESFRPVSRADLRILPSLDDPAARRLATACSAQEWEESALSNTSGARIASYAGGSLGALAGLRELAPGVGDPGVLTHPVHRGRGHGTAAVSGVVQRALAREMLVLYQTLEAYRPAVQIAERLGFRRYGGHLAVRLK